MMHRRLIRLLSVTAHLRNPKPENVDFQEHVSEEKIEPVRYSIKTRMRRNTVVSFPRSSVKS